MLESALPLKQWSGGRYELECSLSTLQRSHSLLTPVTMPVTCQKKEESGVFGTVTLLQGK